MRNVKVKICGVKTLEDALFVETAGADAIGFNFYKKGKRYIEPKVCAEITSKLSPFTAVFGIFVNEDIAEVVKIAKMCSLTVVQLHGDEDNAYIDELKANINVQIVKVLRIKDGADIDKLNEYHGDYFLIDSYCVEYGGSGQRIDFEACERFASSGKKIILAGGLTPDNVGEIVEILNPYAVDTASGVEVSPGVKDLNKVEKFIANAKGI